MNRLSCECNSLEEFYCKLWQSDGIIPTGITVHEIRFRLDTKDYEIVYTPEAEAKRSDVTDEERHSMSLKSIWQTYLRGASRFAYPVYKAWRELSKGFTSNIKNSMLYKYDKQWSGEPSIGMKKHADYIIIIRHPAKEF